MTLAAIARQLARDVSELHFSSPVAHVYNPLHYAWQPHQAYLERFGEQLEVSRRTLLLGMNPGPWGMAQTGVPFGAVSWVRDWLELGGLAVGTPDDEHPKRPVLGFECERQEVSGDRLWGWAAGRYQSPASFFSRFFVLNHCPLLFLEESGRNLTPDKLVAAEREPLVELCDQALRRSVQHLQPARVVGVGAYARKRAATALSGLDIEVGQVLHPSPASPAANRGWRQQAEQQLAELGVQL